MNPPSIGLFCKTCRNDLSWLYQALSSFTRNWRHPEEFTDLVIVADEDCEPNISRWDLKGVRVVYVQPWPDGYCHAMAMKLCADIFCPESTLLILFDSDMRLMKPTEFPDLLERGRPALLYDVWHSDMDQETRHMAKQVWRPAILKSMGRELDRDWMVSAKWLFYPSTFRGARALIEAHRKMPFLQAVYSNQHYDWHQFSSHPMTLCDMQALGIYASQYEPHKYTIRQRTGSEDSPIKQFWSHDPVEEDK